MFDLYKNYYEQGLFTKDDLDLFVEAKMLTADEEAQILTPATAPAAQKKRTVSVRLKG